MPVGHCGRETGKGSQQVKGTLARKLTLWHLGLSPSRGQQRTYIHQSLVRAASKGIISPECPAYTAWLRSGDRPLTAVVFRNTAWCRPLQWFSDFKTHTFTPLHTYTHVHPHMHTTAYTITYTYTLCTHRHTQIQLHTPTCACSYIHTFTHMCTHTSAKHNICMHVTMYTITCIHSYTHTMTRVHSHTYTYTQSNTQSHSHTHTLN